METTENTSTEQPVHQPKKASSGPRTFRDTMQHMIDRQAESATVEPSDTASEHAADTAASHPTDSITGETASQVSKDTAYDTLLQQSENIIANTPLQQPENITANTTPLQQSDNSAGIIAAQNIDSTVEGPSAEQTDTTANDASSEQTDTTDNDTSSGQTDTTDNDASFGQTEENSDNASNDKIKLPAKRLVQYIAAGAAAVLLLTYLGVAFFFQKHFLFHTIINEQDFSCQTVEEARAFFAKEADDYILEIVESGEKIERIVGKDISMTWDDNLKLDYILDKQNAFAWPVEWFKEKSEDVVFRISCDETALSKKVDTLDAVTKEPIPPQSAYPKFDGNAFVIEPEIYGTSLDSEKLKEKVLEFTLALEETMDLQEEGFYEKPKYTTESEEMIQVCKKLNDYCKASVTYEMDTPVVVDKTLISTWLTVDDNLNVTLNEDAVRNWILEFDARYDTLGATRPLTTPAGKATEVSGGTYGWSINEDEEFAALLNSIRNGEVLTRAVSYGQTAASHAPQDWGNTFLEVDLTTQHMWYLKDGAVVFESDVVTGSTPSGMGTPAGVYTILEKLSPTILVGNIVPETGKPEYRTPVDFWMRVTYSGIGFHDATWQPAFGGDVYLWNGSHGCINMPYYNAQELYSMIEVGLPVVIHY